MSKIFGVKTDDLLKDEMGEEEHKNVADYDVRTILVNEANPFMVLMVGHGNLFGGKFSKNKGFG